MLIWIPYRMFNEGDTVRNTIKTKWIHCLLVQGLWRHALTNRPVSREELMMVLADLEGLRIRALYFTRSQRLSLGEVGLETASDSGPGVRAASVEQCTCPPEYAGDSCQVRSLQTFSFWFLLINLVAALSPIWGTRELFVSLNVERRSCL